MTSKNSPLVCKPAPTVHLETLERRDLFAVSMGSDGWTDITPSSDTRVVYVSSSGGNDANGGLSAGAPVKTLAKARSLVRSGSPDWMLLKRGDAWSETLSAWTQSGRGEQEPVVIGAYGTGERPLLRTGNSIGFSNRGAVAHVAIVGVHFHSHTRDTSSPTYDGTTATGGHGFQTTGLLSDVLVEDAVFDDYRGNVSVTGYDGKVTDFTLRRSVITDSWSLDGSGAGLYVHLADRVRVEENVFDHNGWNESPIGLTSTVPSHAVYMSASNGDDIVVRGNVLANSGSHGLQARSGGIIENNLFLRNPINLQFGGGHPTVKAGGVAGRVSGNVILDSRDLNGSNRGFGIDVSNVRPGANVVVEGNILTADTHRKNPAITFDTRTDATNVAEHAGINDLTIRKNIVYDWNSSWNMSGSFVLGGSGVLSANNVKVQDNDFQFSSSRLVRHGPALNSGELSFSGNRYTNHASIATSNWFLIQSTNTTFSTWKANVEPTAQQTTVAYADPVQSIGKYAASIGRDATLSAFLGGARDQAAGAYDGRLTAAAVINHVRKGFAENGVVPGGLLPNPTETATPAPVPAPAPDTAAPTAPAALRGTGATSSTINLAWDGSTDNVGVTGYQVFRNGVKVATTTDTTWADTGRAPSTAYAYEVRAHDAAGNVSAASNGYTVTTLAAPDTAAPTTPANLTVGAVTTSTVALSWTAATDNVAVSGYRVFRNGVQVATTSGTTFTDSGLAADTGYAYTVRAYDAANNVSLDSNAVTGRTAAVAAPAPAPTPTPSPTVPAAPTSLTGVKEQRRARLTWSDSASNEQGFYVYTSTDGVNWSRYATVGAKAGTGSVSYTTGTLKGTRYFRVTAYNAAGQSAATNVVKLTL